MTTQANAESGLNLQPGVVVADKYRLLEPAGEGAMGSVWKAEHTTLGHTVAVKFLHGSVAKAAEPRARFEREARLAAKLGEASRHITRVSDHGVTDDGTPFLVMEFLQGEGLEVRLKRDRRLPIALVAKITAQLSRALHVAHSAGVIHRDLKPANVFLCESQEEGMLVKLLDFGVAKATLDADENQATRAGALIGTPNYMSPEQISAGDSLDARSDLWGLAAIVYRMAVGRAPFGSGALSELAMRIVATEPPQPTSLAPDLPAEFDLWVKKGLAKKPAERFQNARDLADSLSAVAGISSGGSTGAYSSDAAERLAMQLGDSVTGLQHTLGHSNALFAPLPAEPKKKRGGLGVALVMMVLLAGAGIGFFVMRTHAAPPTPPAAAQPPVPPAPTPSAIPTPSAAPEAKAIETASAAPSDSEPSLAPPTKGTSTVKKPVYVAPKATTTAKTTTEVAPPPPPPPPADTAAKPDLWKKKDEM